MTLCPIAIVSGCEKCPAFKICPLKSVIGNAPAKAEPRQPPARAAASGRGKGKPKS